MAEKEEYYDYTPSKGAAVVSLVIFGALFAYHVFRLFRTRTWFCTPFAIGAIFELIGYGCRAYGNSNPDSKLPYILQALLILLAPILFAASVYMFLGRIIRVTGQYSCSMIRPNWLTKIFVGGDILCFLIQAVGAVILASSDTKKSSDLGKAVILVGLFLQIAIFGFFMIVGIVFHLRARRDSGGKSVAADSNWEGYLHQLYMVSVLISIRNVFRVIEYAMGEDGYLLATEWPIYVFDALLMAIVLVICRQWYVREIFTGVQPERQGDFEMTGGPRA